MADDDGKTEIKPDASGYLTMSAKGVFENFAQDLPMAERKLLLATRGATNSTVFGAKVANVAWKNKRTWYLVTAKDRMIQPDLQRKFAKTINATTITVPTSHVAMLSQPSEVTKLIIAAANRLKQAPWCNELKLV
jgi:pimeloyl-ACP methyl ester carboxylesterase